MDRFSDVLSPAASVATWIIIVAAAAALFTVWCSLWTIGPTQVGLVRKRFSLRRLSEGNPVAFGGEAGYQGDLDRKSVV